ncbi:hypothetical protein BV20DRAFT_503401 [Pilatotrama ljubarskyi]|nr:hypothetical protein BV20DRAFT_503401 [Pilatotrama ljubarskyi]
MGTGLLLERIATLPALVHIMAAVEACARVTAHLFLGYLRGHHEPGASASRPLQPPSSAPPLCFGFNRVQLISGYPEEHYAEGYGNRITLAIPATVCNVIARRYALARSHPLPGLLEQGRPAGQAADLKSQGYGPFPWNQRPNLDT